MRTKNRLLLGLFLFGYLVTSRATVLDAVQIAAAQVDSHKQYLSGTNGPDSFDCSGLTWFAFGSIGIELALTALEQSQMPTGTLLTSPAVTELQPGDLLFFETDSNMPGVITHVGLYEGNNNMLSAVSEQFGVRRDDVTTPYWSSRLKSARRLADHVGTPSSKFSIGDAVKVTEDGVSVRRLRQDWDRLGTRMSGDLGSVTYGPVLESLGGTAYWWWKVDFQSGADGWVAEDFLTKLTGPPPPAPSAPSLLTPINGAAVPQNNPNIGCSFTPFRGYGLQVHFDWENSVSSDGIAGYDIVARFQGTAIPIVQTFVSASEYTYTNCNSFVADQNLNNWQWQVRAKSNAGVYGPWSDTGVFNFAPCRLSDGSACSVQPLNTIVDGNFSAWAPFAFITDDPLFAPPGPGTSTATVERVATGGNPGAYLGVTLTIAGGDTIWGGAIKTDYTYDPAVSGAIGSVSVSADVQMPSLGASAWQLVVQQNGRRYFSIPFGTFSGSSWSTVSAANLTATNFDTNPWAGTSGILPDGNQPDFGAAGAPLQFGFLIGNAFRFAGTATALHGLDNFTVTINSQ